MANQYFDRYQYFTNDDGSFLIVLGLKYPSNRLISIFNSGGIKTD